MGVSLRQTVERAYPQEAVYSSAGSHAGRLNQKHLPSSLQNRGRHAKGTPGSIIRSFHEVTVIPRGGGIVELYGVIMHADSEQSRPIKRPRLKSRAADDFAPASSNTTMSLSREADQGPTHATPTGFHHEHRHTLCHAAN